MTRVLLFAATTGYQIRSFGEAADRLGIRLVFASDRCDQLDDPWWDRAIAVRFHNPLGSIEALVSAWEGPPPEGVIAVGDLPAVLAAHASARFGLKGNPAAATERSRNKLETRRAFASAGLPTPAFQVIPVSRDPAALSCVEYPAVIKPLALSGSRGVIRVDTALELAQACERLRELLRSLDIQIQRHPAHGFLLIETFIPGTEYAIEAILTDGALELLAIFDKPDPLDGPYFEETIYLTPSRAPSAVQDAIVESVSAAARALGLRHGPVHAECRVNQFGVYVLEVAARPIGGLCSKVLRFDGGDEGTTSLEELLLRHATGQSVGHYRLARSSSGVMMIPIPGRGLFRGVTGVERARQVAGVEEVNITAKVDERLVPVPEARSYLGFIFARGETPAGVESALREAHGHLHFDIGREIVLVD